MRDGLGKEVGSERSASRIFLVISDSLRRGREPQPRIHDFWNRFPHCTHSLLDMIYRAFSDQLHRSYLLWFLVGFKAVKLRRLNAVLEVVKSKSCRVPPYMLLELREAGLLVSE